MTAHNVVFHAPRVLHNHLYHKLVPGVCLHLSSFIHSYAIRNIDCMHVLYGVYEYLPCIWCYFDSNICNYYIHVYKYVRVYMYILVCLYVSTSTWRSYNPQQVRILEESLKELVKPDYKVLATRVSGFDVDGLAQRLVAEYNVKD